MTISIPFSHPARPAFFRLLRQNAKTCLLLVLLTAFSSLPAFAQVIGNQGTTPITGHVSDDKSQSVIGAIIMVKGTNIGTTSNDSGDYHLSVPANATLIISGMGFPAKEIDVKDRTTVDVTLTSSTTDLEQVVVVGYGRQKKRDVTGAIVSVNESALKEVPVDNLQSALQGRAAGLEVQKTGTKPGAGAVIRIRGERSINGSNDPLLVLDGIPFEGGNLNDINPDDVASVDILKDASATAIYGSRGANGVILVTTKRGKSGDTRVAYSGYTGITSVRNSYNLFDANQYQAMRNTSTWTAGYMPDEQASIAAGRSTDWQKLMYQHGYTTSNNITVSGGGNGTTFSMGAGYYKETTILPGQDFGRYSLRTTIDSKIGKRVRVGLNSMNNLTNTNGSQFNDPMFTILALSPLMPARDSSGGLITSPTGNTDDRVGQYNPLLLKNNNNQWVDRVRRLRTFNSLYGEVQILEGLKYRVNVGLDYRQQESDQFRASDSKLAPSFFRPNQGNTASVNNAVGYGYTLENVLTYDKTINKHRFTFTGLFSYQEDHAHNTYVSKDSIDENFIQFYNLGQANASNNVKPVTTGAEASWALVSYMGRINYAFDDRFLLTLTARSDGSSRLATGHYFHNYGAGSAGWVMSNESFLKEVSWLSNLKARVGYGQTSNQAIDPYSSLGLVSSYNGIGTVGSPGSTIRYNYGPTIVSGYNVVKLPNSQLDWEYTATMNIGLDFGFFHNRITGSAEWYNAKTSNILYGITLPTTSGITDVYLKNIGEMSNKGLEISVTTVNIAKKDGLNWSTDFNFFLNRNKLLKLQEGITQNVASQLFVGQPLTAIYDYTKLGIWQTSEAAEAAKYGNLPGDIKLKDISGPNGVPDGKIDPTYDRSVIGSGQANWQGGITNRLSYKGFDFSFVVYARFGGTLVSQVNQPYAGYIALLDGKRNTIAVDYWTPTNPTNNYPSPSSMLRTRPVGTDLTTLGYYDASFIKVRSINFGYNFTSKVVKKAGAQSLRVYVAVQNPFVLYSPYMRAGGVDPEATGLGNQGIQNPGNLSSRALTISLTTPPTKTIMFGANLNF